MAKVTSRLNTQKDKLGLSPRENVAESAREKDENTNLDRKKSKRKKKQKSPEKYKDIVVVTVDTQEHHDELKEDLDKYRSPPQDSISPKR